VGTALLVVALVVEAGFATYCIVTKSNQRRMRSYIRIGALAAFIVCTLASIIRWDFRWYALAALLAVWAVLGAWALIRNRTPKDDYRPEPIVGRTIGTLLLVFLALSPALIFPQDRAPKVTGTHPVATVNYTYTDERRIESFTTTGEQRKVNVEFWYPRDGSGRYPLVIFSHGVGGMKSSNTSTFLELASNGYVVCSIDHPYQALFTEGSDGHVVTVDPAFYREFLDVNAGKYDEATAFKFEKSWMQLQIDDIQFVFSTILRQAKDPKSDAVYQLVDPGRIGLMGHSLGGESSAQLARERTDIGAVVNLDADLSGEYVDFVNGKRVLNDTVYPVPILTILTDTLTRLIAAVPDANAVVAVEHVSATAPHAYLVHIQGTDHLSVTDLPITSPFLASLMTSAVKKAGGGESADKYYVIDKVNEMILAFFNVYLKGEGSFTYKGTY
jgi:predicted dienelactone hydrolase